MEEILFQGEDGGHGTKIVRVPEAEANATNPVAEGSAESEGTGQEPDTVQ